MKKPSNTSANNTMILQSINAKLGVICDYFEERIEKANNNKRIESFFTERILKPALMVMVGELSRLGLMQVNDSVYATVLKQKPLKPKTKSSNKAKVVSLSKRKSKSTKPTKESKQ
jgi:hypothetical protein